MSHDYCICGKVVTPFRVIEKGMVCVDDERITSVAERDEEVLKKAKKVYEYQDKYITPGFFDIHNHKSNKGFGHEDPKALSEWHLEHGVTSSLLSFDYNQSHTQIMQKLNKAIEEIEDVTSSIEGIYMEGPYINSNYGAVTAPIRPVKRKEYEEILHKAGKYIKVWMLAPELDGQEKFMKYASRYNIVFAVGHSEASADIVFDSYRLGLRLGTHVTNASGSTPPQSLSGGVREVGVDDAVLVHDGMFAEVIADKDGAHVRPLMLKLVLKAKGVDRVILITDAFGHIDEEDYEGPDVKYVMSTKDSPVGEGKKMLTGSLLTLNRAVRNIMNHTGVGIVDACRMASLNPARLLKMDQDIGSLEVGKLANINAVSEKMIADLVMFKGKIIKLK